MSTKKSQNLSRKIQRKEKHNDRTIHTAIEDEKALFARTLKALGNRRFRIAVPDIRGCLHEEEARIGGKAVIRIEINDIVIVARSGRDIEILGRMDRKSTARLQKEKRIHPGLLIAGEWTEDRANKADNDSMEDFEFDYEGLPDSAAAEKAGDDVDVDAI